VDVFLVTNHFRSLEIVCFRTVYFFLLSFFFTFQHENSLTICFTPSDACSWNCTVVFADLYHEFAFLMLLDSRNLLIPSAMFFTVAFQSFFPFYPPFSFTKWRNCEFFRWRAASGPLLGFYSGVPPDRPLLSVYRLARGPLSRPLLEPPPFVYFF